MGIIYADLRLKHFSRPELEEVDAQALVDSGSVDLVIPEAIARQLRLQDLQPREVRLADGTLKCVRYVGPVQVETMGRDCVTGALVMGDQVLLGAIPMQAMDVVIHPRSERLVPNPAHPDGPRFFA